jgi:hydroxypyruvate reductase
LAAHLRKLGRQNPLANDALEIWSAAVRRVLPSVAIPSAIQPADHGLVIGGRFFPRHQFSRLHAFGAGKAGAAMAVELERVLRDSPYWDDLGGRVNVPEHPAGLPPTEKIVLDPVRPARHNFPTLAARDATGRMIADLSRLDDTTLALGLFSGGGSAMLACPRPGVDLSQLLAVTQFLHAAGATIHELNGVRSWLCADKAGGLARCCRAGRIETLLISDVVGDDLGVIASGPCHASQVSAAQAAAVLKHSADRAADIPAEVSQALQFLEQLAALGAAHPPLGDHVRNNLVATNAMALEAASEKARELGYRVVDCGSANEGDAYRGGREFANLCQEHRSESSRTCILSGGEPVLALNPCRPPGCRGGRNQAWALAAIDELCHERRIGLAGIAILAGGTDGEDGPCDVAGAVATQEVIEVARELGLHSDDFIRDNNEYAFFERTGGHLDTGGGTDTNVGDIRVACVGG